MAGIGFELQKLLRAGGIGAFFKVALAGVIIVAGPWILAIVGILLVSSIGGLALTEASELFMGVIIYSYAVSLFLFGGSHYIFTRYLSDLVFQEKDGEAGSSLVFFLVVVFALAAALAYFGLRQVDVRSLTRPLLFRVSAGLFFANVNVLWVVMIFISLLKQYFTIFFTYLVGMAVSVAGVFLLAPRLGLGGAMLGFTVGQTLTTLVLLILSLVPYRPRRFFATVKGFFRYFPKYGMLFGAGLFYYWGIWIDKLVFWFAVGRETAGGFFRLFPVYDIPVYLANLAMIPGLIYFVVASETDFYVSLKVFLESLGNGILSRIRENKYAVVQQLRRSLREQSVFQGILILVLILLAPTLARALFAGGMDVTVFRLTLAAVFFHFLFMTLMTFLFYLELYAQACLASLVFFLVNAAATAIMVLTGGTGVAGLSYLLGGAAGCAAAARLLFSRVRTVDRTIYVRYSLG